MKLQVLGPGCTRCKTLYKNVETAVAELGLEASLEKVEDLREIVKLGVISTPGLVRDGHVLVSGKVPGVEEIKALLR